MAKQKTTSEEDPLHDSDTGMYVGPGVPPSVFYKGIRAHSVPRFKKTSEAGTMYEAELVRQSKRLSRERNARYEAKRKRSAK